MERYRRYLLQERGLGERTAVRYVYVAGRFLAAYSRAGNLDLESVSASAAPTFLAVEGATHSAGWTKAVAVALRSLLRYLRFEGLISGPWDQVIPAPAGWSRASLPRTLKPAEMAALLGSCDRSSATGRRDYAVLLLLARLGLRAGEVAVMELTDVDWRGGTLCIRGKGPRVDLLPLPADVGRALAGYVRRGRPSVGQGAVFRRIGAPHSPLNPVTVTGIVYRACERAGVPRVGAHCLRHFAATQMLRGGASLPEIAQVLRHHSPVTTAIYAKVDRLALAALAQPWPGGTA